jgi:predicted protein tyrosine phosphatase
MIEKVKFIGIREAKTMPGWSTAAMISITQPHGFEADLMDGWHSVYRVTFHDADPENIKTKKVRFPITDEQAIKIVEFVKAVSPEVKTIVVHCGGGISRSAAVAKWIATKYRLSFDDTYDRYNKYVFNALLKADKDQLDT